VRLDRDLCAEPRGRGRRRRGHDPRCGCRQLRRGGIACNEIGTDCTFRTSTIVGSGQPSEAASNGVRIAFGAGGRVTDNVVRGNICGQDVCGPDPLTQDRAAGILTFQAAPGTVISKNDLSNNDVGIWLIEGDGCCRTSENTLTDNRQFGILVHDGSNQTSKNEISGGNIGIAAVALNADIVAISRNDDISGTAVAPVQTFSCCGFTAPSHPSLG
jgi:parallel beta-helix repeat protein